MERNYHYSSLVQVAFKQYNSIRNRYALTEAAPLGNIHMTLNEAMCVLMAALAGRRPTFSDPNCYAYFVRKVILDHFIGKAFKEAVRNGDMLHYNVFASAINPSPLAFCHVAKSILQKDYSRWASELATAGYDAVSVANNVCLKLYFNQCRDSQGNDIKEVMGEVRKAMKHCYIDGLKQIGVYNKGKKDNSECEEHVEKTMLGIFGPKRIPVNRIDVIDTLDPSFDIPEKVDDDVLADNGVEIELQKQIGRDPLTFWMTVAEIAEDIRGFRADEFSAFAAYMYGDKHNLISEKLASEKVAKAFGIPAATVSSHYYRSMEKVKTMGAKKADAMIALLRSKYADAQEDEL